MVDKAVTLPKTASATAATTAPTDRKLPLSQLLPLGFQHGVIAILAAIPVPLIISANAGLSPAETRYFVSAIIFCAGISSLLASLNLLPRTSPLIPMALGANFAVIPVVSSTLTGATSIKEGFALVAGCTMFAGLCCFLLAGVWVKLKRFFPPIVVGTNLMVLGVALLPNTFHWMMGTAANDLTQAIPLQPFLLALGIFLFHVILSKFLKGLLGNLTILIALLVGTVVAGFMGMVDLSPVADAPWFALNLPGHYGLPKLNLSLLPSYLIVMILGMVEVSGTSMGIHAIVDKEMDEAQFGKTLRTLGLATFVSGGFNAVQPTAFVQNLGILDLSKEKSRYATAAAGGMLLLAGFVPKLSAVIAAIPTPVLGGVGFAIFGVIIGSAVNMLKQVDFSGNQNMLIIGLSVGVAMLPSVYPHFYGEFPQLVQNIFGSGILAGALTSISLNFFFNFRQLVGKAAKAPSTAAPDCEVETAE